MFHWFYLIKYLSIYISILYIASPTPPQFVFLPSLPCFTLFKNQSPPLPPLTIQTKTALLPPIYRSINLSIYLFIHMFISIYLSIYLTGEPWLWGTKPSTPSSPTPWRPRDIYLYSIYLYLFIHLLLSIHLSRALWLWRTTPATQSTPTSWWPGISIYLSIFYLSIYLSFIFLSICFYLSFYLSFYPPVSIYLSRAPWMWRTTLVTPSSSTPWKPGISLSSIYLSIYLFMIYLSICFYLPIYLVHRGCYAGNTIFFQSVEAAGYLSIFYLSIYLSIFLSICFFISIYLGHRGRDGQRWQHSLLPLRGGRGYLSIFYLHI